MPIWRSLGRWGMAPPREPVRRPSACKHGVRDSIAGPIRAPSVSAGVWGTDGVFINRRVFCKQPVALRTHSLALGVLIRYPTRVMTHATSLFREPPKLLRPASTGPSCAGWRFFVDRGQCRVATGEAAVAELADALDLGSSDRKVVEVRVLSAAIRPIIFLT